MSFSWNQVTIGGNLTGDPQTKTLATGTTVTEISIAINERRKDRDETTFVDVVLFGRTAEIVSQYFTRGKPILLTGRLKLDSWQSRSGEKRSKLRVVGDRITFVGGRDGGGDSRGGAAASRDESEPSNPQQGGFGGDLGGSVGGFGGDLDLGSMPF